VGIRVRTRCPTQSFVFSGVVLQLPRSMFFKAFGSEEEGTASPLWKHRCSDQDNLLPHAYFSWGLTSGCFESLKIVCWWFGEGVRREYAQRRKAGALVRGGVAYVFSRKRYVTDPFSFRHILK